MNNSKHYITALYIMIDYMIQHVEYHNTISRLAYPREFAAIQQFCNVICTYFCFSRLYSKTLVRANRFLLQEMET